MYRFHAVPPWALVDTAQVPDEVLRPSIADDALLTAVLAHVEYRGEAAGSRAARLAEEASGPTLFARSPNDLPALLRTADQLHTMARIEAGERAQHRRCACGAPYAIPVAAVRPLTLRCTRCGSTVDLDPAPAGEVKAPPGPATTVIDARVALSAFFREAMARSWAVLVSKA